MAAVTFKEYSLQDGNTLEATQIMLESRVVTAFPLNDQEILCRHLHKVAADWVDDYTRETRGGGPMSDAAAARRVRRVRAVRARRGACRPKRERYAQRLASTMDEMQTFYDAFFPRAEEAIAYCEKFPLDDMPEDARAAAPAALLARDGVVPGGGVAPAARSRLRRRVPRPPDRAAPVSDAIDPARRPVGRHRRG